MKVDYTKYMDENSDEQFETEYFSKIKRQKPEKDIEARDKGRKRNHRTKKKSEKEL